MFEANDMPRIRTVETLGNGEFNAAFQVCTEENKEYVVKIAPPRDSKVLTYDNNMMESEVFWYEAIRGMVLNLIKDCEAMGTETPNGQPIVYDQNMEIRYQVAVGYLALIEEVEKYVRYEPEEENYIRNTVDVEAMFEMAFGVLLS